MIKKTLRHFSTTEAAIVQWKSPSMRSKHELGTKGCFECVATSWTRSISGAKRATLGLWRVSGTFPNFIGVKLREYSWSRGVGPDLLIAGDPWKALDHLLLSLIDAHTRRCLCLPSLRKAANKVEQKPALPPREKELPAMAAGSHLNQSAPTCLGASPAPSLTSSASPGSPRRWSSCSSWWRLLCSNAGSCLTFPQRHFPQSQPGEEEAEKSRQIGLWRNIWIGQCEINIFPRRFVFVKKKTKKRRLSRQHAKRNVQDVDKVEKAFVFCEFPQAQENMRKYMYLCVTFGWRICAHHSGDRPQLGNTGWTRGNRPRIGNTGWTKELCQSRVFALHLRNELQICWVQRHSVDSEALAQDGICLAAVRFFFLEVLQKVGKTNIFEQHSKQRMDSLWLASRRLSSARLMERQPPRKFQRGAFCAL